MDIDLSNSIINLYNKKNNKISFHYKTDLLIKTNCTFGNNFIEDINVSIILSDKRKFEFDKILIMEDRYPFTGDSYNRCASGGTGMGIMAIIVGAERGFIKRKNAAERILYPAYA